MSYTGDWTNTAEVKKIAGMENNPHISEDNDITLYIKSAEAEVKSAISLRYSLPLSDNDYYSGSSAEYLLQDLARNLAAGLLMQRQYKSQGGSLETLADSKVEYARELIKRIAGICGNCPKILLIGTDNNELATADTNSGGITGFPNNSDDTDEASDNPNAIVTMDTTF